VFLLDTNILSELVRKRPDPRVEARFQQAQEETLFTSAVCLEEIRFGCAIIPEGNLRWRRIHAKVLHRVRTLVFDYRAALIAGDLRGQWKTAGTPVGYEDGLIAATARSHGLTLVTRNTRHFDHVTGLKVENWFE
jgi:predicted nucleic acid-binding protein